MGATWQSVSHRASTKIAQLMKRALVTGGTGFVGANLVRRLLADGHEVHLMLRADHDPWRLAMIRSNVRVVVGDVADRSDVSRALDTVRPEWLFHLAAYGAYPMQIDPLVAARTNVLGTITLLEEASARGFEAFVHAGSSSEYGRKDHAPTETEATQPTTAYAATKVAGTVYCGYVAQRDRARVATLRLYSAYGPFEEPSRLVPTLLVHALDRRLPPLAHPDTARDYVAVSDVCDAFVRAAESMRAGGAIYNVGTGRQTSLRQLVNIVRAALGVDVEPVWGSFPDRAWDTDVWVGDASRLRLDLGWTPRSSLPDGLRAFADWLRAEPGILERYRAITASRSLTTADDRRT
jgi:dolichol-phosphate mannosyltransferase